VETFCGLGLGKRILINSKDGRYTQENAVNEGGN